MANSKSQTLDPKLDTALSQLKQFAADASTLMNLPAWAKQYKDKTTEDTIDGFNNEELTAQFNRDETSKTYLQATVTEPNTSYQVAQTAKIQGDMLSAIERDTRMRYRSRVRMMLHAVARSKSQAMEGGIVDTLKTNIASLLVSTDDGNN